MSNFFPSSRSQAPVQPFLTEVPWTGRGYWKTGSMDWTRLMIGLVFLLNPVHGNQTGKITPSCVSPDICSAEDLKFTFNKDETNSNKLVMCLIKDEVCEGCYTLMKKECDSGYCWKIISTTDAQKINYTVGIMGGVIAVLVVVMLAAIVVYICTSVSSKQLDQKNGHETVDYVRPIIPRRPSHSLKDKQVTQNEYDPDYGYIQGNDPKFCQIKDLENRQVFQGKVIA
ncbi:uncharacterized protein LOC135111506 isoform X3 [Scylla paramamosain]|uniref:uncharacterized protein LOC135111506 isoform X3 n=1 Tax=Scylla paramamosain TaxID=85552 RepID=UPI00308304EC